MLKAYEDALANLMLDNDYIGLWEVMRFAAPIVNADAFNPKGNDSEVLLQATLTLVRLMLSNGYLVIDLVKDSSSYKAWPDQDRDHLAAYIAENWRTTKNPIGDLGYGVYFVLPRK